MGRPQPFSIIGIFGYRTIIPIVSACSSFVGMRPKVLQASRRSYHLSYRATSFYRPRYRLILSQKLTVLIPRLITISILYSRTIGTMTLTILIPRLSAISILYSRTIIPMKLTVLIPILTTISILYSRTIGAMKLYRFDTNT